MSISNDMPALLGGAAVFPDGPPDWPMADADVTAALQDALAKNSWGKYHGEHLPRLESELATFFEVRFVLTCASGTLAVEAAMHALKVRPGDRIAIPAYDYEGNFLNAHAAGAKPVLMDVAAKNACVEAEALERIADCGVAIVSHLHGGLAPMRHLREVADRKRIALIEDAAQVCGGSIDGRKAGSWGDIGILSFGGSKLLSAGRGGALLIHDRSVYQRAKSWLSRGVQQWAALSELQAIVLIPQLAKLAANTTYRRRQTERLVDRLRAIDGLRMFENDSASCEAGYYKVGFWFDEAAFGLSRPQFVRAMRAEGVAFDEGFRALHIGRAPKRFHASGPLPNAEKAHHSVVMLHHPVLSLAPEAIDKVARAVEKTYRNRQRLQG